MNVHKNARLTPHGRERIVRQVESGQTLKAVGEAAGVCPRTVRKWVSRYRSEGLAGLRDRSSRPHRLHRPTPQAVVAEVACLRRQRYTGQQIAAGLRISPATVSRILRRLGLNRLAALEPAEPVRRYEREHPGELIHIDIKKLGRFNRVGHRITGDRRGQSNSRGVGWEYVHVCIDDASRIAYAEIKKSERKASAIAFLKAAVIYYAKLGISMDSNLYGNGEAYAEELNAVIAAASLRRPVLVGWSYGTRIISDYLVRYGSASLAGINFVGAVGNNDPTHFGSAMPLIPKTGTEDLVQSIEATKAFIRGCFEKQPTAEEFETILAFNMVVPAKIRGWLRRPAPSYEQALKAVSVPTLVTHGVEDRILGIGLGKYLATTVPGAKASFYQGIGHAPFWEDASRFNQELSEFVKSTAPPGKSDP